ncbi:VWA domain-containing protein [Phyllobacterium phragmitis]|uniref:VWA domain-containing protein n=1 Tax=Phyllobacterium phragmitis TaxID=2670329 RepID=A0A2S9IL65_9HYPH|nr:vWA domain-containing protein [Phyllobacterium phragmitis]PRD41271.1 VWA domain-containing protein [Phyllobacterium phragmitis]
MNFAVDHPAVLLLLPLAFLPFVATVFAASGYPSLTAVPRDRLSFATDIGLHLAGALAIAAIVFGLAGFHRREQPVERIGNGANVVLLFDRSSSMDNSFGNRLPSGSEESKSDAAKRLISDFVTRRPHDRIGVAAFSTSPMPVLPLTSRHDTVKAAVAAIDRPGLAKTDVGRGLVLAMTMFDENAANASRAVVLVSDGAAVIDRRVQATLRSIAARTPLNLYWLFLRTKGSRGIFDPPDPRQPDTPQVNPERHLHLFLSTLGIPYRAFEAGSPQAVEQAIAEIDKQEMRPLAYFERIPRRDLSSLCYAIAAVAVALLALAKLAERGLAERYRPALAPGGKRG